VRTKLILGVVAMQVLALAYMAAEREWVLRTGRTIYLRTAPIDPRDAMRGDYVRLTYDISRVPRALCRGRLVATNETFEALPRDTKVYAALRVNEHGEGELDALSIERPADGLFVRGRTDRSWSENLQVRYGLEAFFTEQGKGLELERGRNRDGIQVPLEMKVAVSPGGLAVLKGYRWAVLGIGLDLETEEVPGPNTQRQRRTVAATVRLLNANSSDLAVVDLPGGRSLALVPDAQWGDPPWQWLHEDETRPAPEPAQVIVLKPGQVHAIKIPFDDPLWSVIKKQGERSGKPAPVKLADLTQDWSARFRLEYRPPDRASCMNLPNANLIWHGRLPSRAFNPGGNVD
jgi:uncharacterized membrane-anchored protein